jgi:hypothetical protein
MPAADPDSISATYQGLERALASGSAPHDGSTLNRIRTFE